MRCRTAVFGACLVIISAVQLPAQAFKPGANYIGPYVSLATYGSTAAFGAEFEHAINDRWGWGIGADYFSFNEFGVSTSYFSVAGLGAYHFPVSNEKLDPFVGAAIGYNVVSVNEDCDGCHASGILIGAFGGLRYWVNDKIAVVGRAGYGLGFLSVGVDFKM